VAPAQSANDWTPIQRIESGTTIDIRTTEQIAADSSNGRIFTGVVDRDVLDRDGRLAIPEGSTAELTVRRAPDSQLSLDLESVTVNGQRYAVRTTADAAVGTSGTSGGIGANRETAEYIGGGALIGSVIGAIAGGGKGAAIGAAVGAAAGAGAQVITHGKDVEVPAETLLTFKLDRGMELGVPDTGWDTEGSHYHGFRSRGR